MDHHQKEADRSKGKELATSSPESSPHWSTYNAHCVRLALEACERPEWTNIRDRDTFGLTLSGIHIIKKMRFIEPIFHGRQLDLHSLFMEVIARGGMRKVGMEGRLGEVRDVVSPTMSLLDLYHLYHTYLLHYFEDFVAQNMPGSELSFPEIPDRDHGDFEQGQVVETHQTERVVRAVSCSEISHQNMNSTQLRLPDMSSSLWGMAEELLTGLSGAIASGKPERNIVSPPLPSSGDVVDQRARNQAFAPSTGELDLSLLLSNSSWKLEPLPGPAAPELRSPARAIQAETEIPVMPEAKHPPKDQRTVPYSLSVEDLAGAEKKKVNIADPLPSATYEGESDGDDCIVDFSGTGHSRRGSLRKCDSGEETIDEELDGRSSPGTRTKDDEKMSESFSPFSRKE